MDTSYIIERAIERRRALKALMASSDKDLMKCMKFGLSFAETYPEEYSEYIAANEEYNDLGERIAALREQLKAEEEARAAEGQDLK